MPRKIRDFECFLWGKDAGNRVCLEEGRCTRWKKLRSARLRKGSQVQGLRDEVVSSSNQTLIAQPEERGTPITHKENMDRAYERAPNRPIAKGDRRPINVGGGRGSAREANTDHAGGGETHRELQRHNSSRRGSGTPSAVFLRQGSRKRIYQNLEPKTSWQLGWSEAPAQQKNGGRETTDQAGTRSELK